MHEKKDIMMPMGVILGDPSRSSLDFPSIRGLSEVSSMMPRLDLQSCR